jgi:UDP-N-acetylglucosamine transferase subunit ALG13
MIFVTVGSDIPFDRLLKAVDSWARENNRQDVFAQIGTHAWKPDYIAFTPMLSPAEFRERLIASNVVVGHAGMGTILSALGHSKPILVMPRRLALNETRNDHQMATAEHLLAMDKINVAFDEVELRVKLDQIDALIPREKIPPLATGPLIEGLRSFIFNT